MGTSVKLMGVKKKAGLLRHRAQRPSIRLGLRQVTWLEKTQPGETLLFLQPRQVIQ